MADFPRAAKLVQLSTGVVAKLQLTRPKSYYSRGGTVRLAPGQTQVVVNFPTPVKDVNWVFGGLTFWNVGDADIDVVDLSALGRVNKSQAGFTLLISPPPTDNYYLDWTIAEATNP